MARYLSAYATVSADEAKNPGIFATVGTSSGLILPANADRVELVIGNDHATNVVYLCLGAAAFVGRGIRLNPAGGTYVTLAYNGPVYAISTGAGTNVTIAEI